MPKLKKVSFSDKNTTLIRRYLDASVAKESVKDRDSLWGKLALIIFNQNDIKLRKKVRRKWHLEKDKAAPEKRSRTGRKCFTPFWMKRRSYMTVFKKAKKRQTVRKAPTANLFDAYRKTLHELRQQEKLKEKNANQEERKKSGADTVEQSDEEINEKRGTSRFDERDTSKSEILSDSDKGNESEEVSFGEISTEDDDVIKSSINTDVDESIHSTNDDPLKDTNLEEGKIESDGDTRKEDVDGDESITDDHDAAKTDVSDDRNNESNDTDKKKETDSNASLSDMTEKAGSGMDPTASHRYKNGDENCEKKRNKDTSSDNEVPCKREYPEEQEFDIQFEDYYQSTHQNSSGSEVSKNDYKDVSWDEGSYSTHKKYKKEPHILHQTSDEEKQISSSGTKGESERADFGSDFEQYFDKIKNIKSFKINLKPIEWEAVQPRPEKPNKLVAGWTDMFSQKFNETISSCVLRFSYQNIIRKSKKDAAYFSCRAECKHENCGVFKFVLKQRPRKDQQVLINVSVVRPIIRHKIGVIRKRQLKGKRRRLAQEKLKTQTPSSLHNVQFGEMPEEEILAGNYTKCQTETVYRKAKSDWIVHDVLHNDPFTELVIIQDILRNEDEDSTSIIGYIQEISFIPFMVVMFMEMSLVVAKLNIRNGDGVFHFDATGSIAKRMTNKRLLYYALVVKSSGGESKAVPVLEFITDHHGTYFIARPLLTFFSHLGQAYRPVRIEVDFSWALIHSSLLAANCMDIHTYLRVCFDVVHGKKVNVFTTVHLCATHMLKTVRDNLKDKTKDKGMRQLSLRMFALMQNTTTLKEAVSLWRLWCTVYNNKYLTERVEESVDEMNRIVKKASIEELEKIDDPLVCTEKSEGDAEFVSPHGKIREQSPFCAFFMQYVSSEKELDEEDADIENPHYLPEVIDMMAEQYMPLIPLWNGFMLEGDGGQKKTRDNNAPVEAWIHSIKDSILVKKRSLRVGKLLGLIHKNLKGRLRKHIVVTKTTQTKKTRKKNIEEPDISEEAWNKKQPTDKTSKAKKNFFYSTPKKVPTPKPRRKMKQKDAREQEKTRKQRRTDEAETRKERKMTPTDSEGDASEDRIKPDSAEEYSGGPDSPKYFYSPPKKIPTPEPKEDFKQTEAREPEHSKKKSTKYEGLGKKTKKQMNRESEETDAFRENRREDSEEPDIAKEGWKKNRCDRNKSKRKNIFYSPPKKVPTPTPRKKASQKNANKTKETTQPMKKDSKSKQRDNKERVKTGVKRSKDFESRQHKEDKKRRPTYKEGEKSEGSYVGKTDEKLKRGKQNVKKQGSRTNEKYMEEEEFDGMKKSNVKKRARYESSAHVVPGLRNRRNTCWLNSCLQALAAVSEINLQGQDEVTLNTQALLTMIRTADMRTGVLCTEDLTMAINRNITSLPIGEYHDPAFFLNHLLQGDTQFQTAVDSILECLSCRNKKCTSEIMVPVAVEIPYREMVTVQDCMNEFTKEELLCGENMAFCDNCQRDRNHLKHFVIKEEGCHCLILQLKRYVQHKNGRLVKKRTAVLVDWLVSVRARVYRVTAIQENSYLIYYDQIQVSNPYAGQGTADGQEKKFIDSLLAQLQDKSVVTIQRHIQLKRQDLKTLDDGKWVNDQIVNLYFKLLEKECPDVSVLDVFFFVDVAVNKKDGSKWLNDDTFKKGKVLVPVIQNGHWCLVVLQMKDRNVRTMDSCNEPNICGTYIRNFLEKCDKCPSQWSIQRAKNLPRQMNASDCGIFMCQFAACEAFDIDTAFTQEDIKRYRSAMKVECLMGQLLPRTQL